MDFQRHPACNHTLGPPRGWDQGTIQCDELPILVAKMEGLPVVQSFWRPSPAELELINSRGYICLTVFGNGMPPVSVEVVA